MEYYIEVIRRFRVCVEAESKEEAQAIALEHAEAMSHGIPDDEDAVILEEVKE